RNDLSFLSELAHEHNAYLVVDAIQSAGAIKIDVKRDNVDFLITACYKWLLGPSGIGFLYVKEELIEKFEPPMVGWASVEPQVFETVDFWDIWNLRLSKTASRFEVGGPNVIGCIGAAAALKLILGYGIEKIENRILSLTDYLIDRVREAGWKLQTPEEKSYRSGIVNFLVDKPMERVEQLAKKGIIVSARANGIRVSPHFYNTREEIDRLVSELLKQQ
ncbi:aminotransferase class V-fold PLP-dependent enzyme, partial [Candidatus Bathyarchaeota archaeon]|nr:aminotransferase class V-fold PLP-dependent enzyme [Candidatus Bathyarchaeota archaeon]